MKNLLYLIIILLLPYWGYSQINNCDLLPKQFRSYEEAISLVKSAKFKIKDEVNTAKSSWVREAFYFSCDGRVGFFLIKTDNKEYMHEGLPYSLWVDFKNSSSFGTFYNFYIKNKFHLRIE